MGDGQRQRHIWCSPTSTCSSNREGHKDTRIPSLSHTTRSAFPRILPPNMATSSSRISYSTIFGTVAATVAASGLAYAVYFDYMRRNNVEFRRNLLKEQKKVAKQAHVEASKGKEATADALKNAVRQMKSKPVPTNVEEREAYFLEQVAIGEALAAKGPAFYVPAAISFFKGLQVYPQPQELLMIYSKTQPAEVVQLLMDALRISISEGEGSSSDSSSSASRTGHPRRDRYRRQRKGQPAGYRHRRQRVKQPERRAKHFCLVFHELTRDGQQLRRRRSTERLQQRRRGVLVRRLAQSNEVDS